MAGAYTSVLNKAVIDTRLREEVYANYLFTKMVGFPTYDGLSNKWVLSGSPIERFTDFKTTGRNQLIASMLKDVYGYGFDGKQTMQGNEEQMGMYYAKLFLHLKKQAVEIPDEVDLEKVSWAQLDKIARKPLVRWFAGYLNTDMSIALLEGYSRHLTNSVVNGGLAKTKQYMKNFWIWDGGDSNFSTNAPTYSHTSDTYKDSLIAKLGTIDTADTMSTTLLEELIPEVEYAGIEPWMVDGEEIYPLILHSRQIADLRQSTNWLNAVARAGIRGKTNPIFKYAEAYWGKFLIIQDDRVVRLAYANGSTLDFADYSAGALCTATSGQYEKVQKPGTNQHVACGILLGRSAVGETLYRDLYYVKNDENYAEIRGLSVKRFYGFNRLDYFDDEVDVTTPTAMANPQSAIIATYV